MLVRRKEQTGSNKSVGRGFFHVSEYVTWKSSNGVRVILDHRTGRFYGLNASASVMWPPIAHGESPNEAVKQPTNMLGAPLTDRVKGTVQSFAD